MKTIPQNDAQACYVRDAETTRKEEDQEASTSREEAENRLLIVGTDLRDYIV
jgi:hypothetical protein